MVQNSPQHLIEVLGGIYTGKVDVRVNATLVDAAESRAKDR